MPIGKYFKGHGKDVMDSMKDTYKDPKKAKHVFYATANKQGMTPGPKRKASMADRIAAMGKKKY